jgi:hydroxymethylglutaryl-CoA lyase
MSSAPITIVEVGPRDGLQTIASPVPTSTKIAFVNALSRTGLREIEVTAFVLPDRVPQLADAAEVLAGIDRVPGVRYSALVPNAHGFELALAARVDAIAVFTAASETFNRRNINASIAESLERFRQFVPGAPVPVRGYVSMVVHCPFEGPIAPEVVVRVAEELLALGCSEISLGDTIGRATTDDTRRLLDQVLRVCPADRIALHFHDTFGRAVENAILSAGLGIARFDGSAGGIGGCPFAPGAPGNVATQALCRAFEGRTGVDVSALDAASALLAGFDR